MIKPTFNLGNYPLKSSKPRWKNLDNYRAVDRKILRSAFGNEEYKKKDSSKSTWAFDKDNNKQITPFRMAMNAGDINNTVNKHVDENILPKQSNPIHSNLGNMHIAYLGVSNSTSVNGSYYSGNPKYVYDGSDYVRFKKLQTMNRNYNDASYGGDDSNASQSALKRVRK